MAEEKEFELKETFTGIAKRLSDFIARQNIAEPAEFEQSLKEHVLEQVVSIAVAAIGTVNLPQDNRERSMGPYRERLSAEARRLIARGTTQNSGHIPAAVNAYRHVFAQLNNATNQRRQGVKALVIDRALLLGFRILTSLSIASVILLTAYVAHRWDIPLPMVRPGSF